MYYRHLKWVIILPHCPECSDDQSLAPYQFWSKSWHYFVTHTQYYTVFDVFSGYIGLNLSSYLLDKYTVTWVRPPALYIDIHWIFSWSLSIVYKYDLMACLECSHEDKEHIFALFQDIDHSSLVVGYVCQLHIEVLSCFAWHWQGWKLLNQYDDLKLYWTLHLGSLLFGAFLESAGFLFIYKKFSQTYPLKTLLGEVHSNILSCHLLLRHQCLKPVLLATLKAQIRRIMVQI
jgi:hypothetical protein